MGATSAALIYGFPSYGTRRAKTPRWITHPRQLIFVASVRSSNPLLPGDCPGLIQVEAASINNTDINTRIGWYSKAVSGDTNSTATGGADTADAGDASWSGVPLTFPRIQGGDVYGRIVSAGSEVDNGRIGGPRHCPHPDAPLRSAAPL
jgi:hypothetical protein